MPETVATIGLAQAGNFGDDLILVAVAKAISSAFPAAEVHHLDFGSPLNWEAVRRQAGITVGLVSWQPPRDIPGTNRISRMFGHCDVTVFGGGGLLQTSHHPMRPYHWLRYLGSGRKARPSLAVGLGLGPLDGAWYQRLRRQGTPFTECYVRDDYSLRLARQELGWDAQRSSDFIDGTFLREVGLSGSAQGNDSLGVALRDWPGLKSNDLAQHIFDVANREGRNSVEFFVLESKSGKGPDVDFTRAVQKALPSSLPSIVHIYQGGDPLEFARLLLRCSTAISMKLHSSAVWAAAGASVYPIFYAPKTAELFGRPWRGLEVGDKPIPVVTDERTVPRAHDVTRSWLLKTYERADRPSPSGFSPTRRLEYQTRSAATDAYRKIQGRIAVKTASRG